LANYNEGEIRNNILVEFSNIKFNKNSLNVAWVLFNVKHPEVFTYIHINYTVSNTTNFIVILEFLDMFRLLSSLLQALQELDPR